MRSKSIAHSTIKLETEHKISKCEKSFLILRNFLALTTISYVLDLGILHAAASNTSVSKAPSSKTPSNKTSTTMTPSTTKSVEANNGKTKPGKKKKTKYTDSFFATSNEAKEKSEKELKLVLSGLNALIPMEKSIHKRNELLLSKAVTLLSLGKKYYLNNKLPSAKAIKESYLKKAMIAADEGSKHSDAKIALKAKALHVYGMASLYMDNEVKSVEYFDQAIKLDPESPLSPRLSLFIGEYYFDNEKFEAALPYYGQYFNRLNPEEKSLALYKSGWCFLALKQYENAEKSFLKIVGKSWAGDFGIDSIRDLAQTVTSHRSETDVIAFGVANLAKENSTEILIDFYTNAYLILLRQSGNSESLVLYNEILRLEKRPEKRVALAIKKLISHQKNYASQKVFKDIIEIDSLITQGGLKPETDLFRQFGSDLELELKKSITAYIDTIGKKVKSPEIFSDLDMAGKLQKFLWYHVSWFPHSPHLPETYMIAMDNCSYLKDADCSLRIARLVLRQESLKNVWPKARVEMLVALEELSKKNPKYQSEYFSELKNYADKQTTDKDWLAFTKKLTVIYMSEKKFVEAEPYLTKILHAENNPENLYRKIFCQFNQNKFSDVVAHLQQIPKEGAFKNEITSLIRESSLSLAKDFSEKKDFLNYEKYLFQFLNLNPEPEKADLAKADYLSKLLERKYFDKVITFFSKIPAEKKFAGSFQKPMELLLHNLFAMNRFGEAKTILSNGSIFGQYRTFDYYWLRVNIAEGVPFTEKDFKIFSGSQPSVRLGILSLAAVSQPQFLSEYFRWMAPADDKEKRVWLLSRQMAQGEKSIALSPLERNFLAALAGSEVLPVGPLKSEKLSKLIEFPQPQWSQQRLARYTPDAMERVKAVRKQIIRDLKDQRFDVQKRILFNGINVERKMAWFFDESPIPSGLSEAELKDYKEQIDGFAKDYYQQISEYEKLLAMIQTKESEFGGVQLSVPKDISQWKRTKNKSLQVLESEINQKRYIRSLIVLESLKELGAISEDDHYRWRGFVVLHQFPHEFASHYLQEELTTFKQQPVLSDWGKLVGLQLNFRSTASADKEKP